MKLKIVFCIMLGGLIKAATKLFELVKDDKLF